MLDLYRGAILTRFDDVGPLRHGDRRTDIDLRTHHYTDAISLAGHIIDGVHRVLGHGDRLAWTFLIPTPLLFEAGVRRELARHLGPHIAVDKHSLPLTGTTMRMNPDLVFGNITAVGDVKYKLMSADWSRSDLNQIVAFAASRANEHRDRGRIPSNGNRSTPNRRGRRLQQRRHQLACR